MYDAFSSDYDRFVNWPARLSVEMPFLETHLRKTSTERPVRVLDAACGTGMHAIALAQRGFQTSGADFSLKMIEHAQQNAAEAGVQVRFETAGFGELSPIFGEGTFEAVICLGNSLPHLLTRETLVMALADFANCLVPQGMLIIQNRNFDAVIEQQDRFMEPQSYLEENREWLFLRFYDFEPGDLLTFNVVSLYREQPESWQQQVHTTRLQALTQKKLDSALRDAGYGEIEYLGSPSGAVFDPKSSGNLIAVARNMA